MRGEQLEASHRVVCSRDQRIDLIGLLAQGGVITSKVPLGRTPLFLEEKAEPLDRAQAPGYSGREQRVYEGIGVGQHCPARTCRPGEAMLDSRFVSERHEGLRVAK